MARSVEGSSRSSASVDEVWAVWTDPGGWFGGPIEAAELDGTFAVGSKYTTKLKGYSPATATISRIEAPRLWTSVIVRRMLTVTVEHVVEPAGDETLLTERWIMSGPLGPIVALLLAWRIRSTQIAATAHLARIAEARVPTRSASGSGNP
jgi:Polyketide cyclase / dehydrase and lipid transport